MNQSKNSTPKIAIPKTADGCSVAVTASIGKASVMNFIDTAHYPKGGGTNHQTNMIIYRNKHGSFKGGLFKTKISPTITIASFEHNTFILKIKECAKKL